MASEDSTTGEDRSGERGRGADPTPGMPPVVVPGEKGGDPGPVRQWWADPIHRQALVAVVAVAIFAGAVWYLGTRVGAVRPPSRAPADAAFESPEVTEFRTLQDSLDAGIRRYTERREGFEEGTVACPELAAVYRRVDSLFVEEAARYQAVRIRLAPDRRSRHRTLFDRMTTVNQSYDESNCPRPD